MAFDELYMRHMSRLTVFFIAHGASSAMAQDLTQDCFFKVIKKSQSFDPTRGSFLPWLYTIASNLRRTSLRKIKDEVFADAEWWKSIPDAKKTVETLDIKVLLDQALHCLPDEQREVLILRTVGLTEAEIAAVLRIPVGTVSSRTFAARTALRTLMGERSWPKTRHPNREGAERDRPRKTTP